MEIIPNYSLILSHTISPKTSEEISRIVTYLNHTVDFKPLPANNSIGFGRTDYTTSPHWTVYSILELPPRVFEANILHELYHLCQVVESFPTTSTRNKPNATLSEKDNFNRLGSLYASVILDLDVCDRISDFGLSSEYFFDIRYKQAMSYHIDYEIVDRCDFISMAMRLAGMILQNNRIQSKNVLDHYKAKNPRLINCAKSLANKIKKIDYHTPVGCLQAISAVYDYLQVWDWQFITYSGQNFTSSEQVHTFLLQSHPDS